MGGTQVPSTKPPKLSSEKRKKKKNGKRKMRKCPESPEPSFESEAHDGIWVGTARAVSFLVHCRATVKPSLTYIHSRSLVVYS